MLTTDYRSEDEFWLVEEEVMVPERMVVVRFLSFFSEVHTVVWYWGWGGGVI